MQLKATGLRYWHRKHDVQELIELWRFALRTFFTDTVYS
jgi:hypothetical protein